MTVVLISVFVPLAFFAGSTGNIYRQFSAVMVASSGSRHSWRCRSRRPFVPRCSNLSKQAITHERAAFGWFNRSFFASGAKAL